MAASYEARAFGVRSAMPLAIAGRLCPEGIYVSGNFDRYLEASDAVMAIFDEKTPLVEPISLDEAFLDVTATEHLFGGPVAIAKEIKRAVREGCGLVVSVGVATNKLCAKVGSDLRKPDGLVIVPEGGEAAFLAPLPMERLWGVGPQTREVLSGWGLRTIGQLAAFDRAVLETRLGEHGTDIWQRANGIDDGEQAVIEWTMTWRDPKSGEPRLDRGAEWFAFRDGKICEIRAYHHGDQKNPTGDLLARRRRR
jgi:DNA polymerase-4